MKFGESKMIISSIERVVLGCRGNAGINIIRCFTSTTLYSSQPKSRLYLQTTFTGIKVFGRNWTTDSTATGNKNVGKLSRDVQANILGVQLKKRPLRKKRLITDDEDAPQPGFWNVKALATAEEYNLEALMEGLLAQDLYLPQKISSSGKSLPDVIHAIPKYEIDHEAKEIYFFREGTVVMWNIPELESGNLLQFLKPYEDSGYSQHLVQTESEMMSYTYTEPGKRSHLKDGDIYLGVDATNLDKYTFSNAISQSVKLGIWEASLEAYIDSIEFVTEDLKAGRRIKMTREEVLRKQGELFALRHLINLSSDLLDTPDFYWENDELETLYQQTCGYFSIAKRTRVMNEKINHCVELVELLSSHLSDRHHVRLEWMIIVLIMVEVAFETLHYLDRYLEKGVSEEKQEHRSYPLPS